MQISKRKTFKRISKIIVFVIMNLLIGYLFQFLLSPYSFRVKMDDFRNDNYSTVIIGTSWARDGINPFVLSDEENGKAFNAGQSSFPLNQTNALIKEMKTTSEVKTVYLELCYEIWETGAVKQGKNLYLNNYLECMSLKNKVDYIVNNLLEQNYNNIFFPYEFKGLKYIKNNIKVKTTYKKGNQEQIKELLTDGRSEYRGQGFNYVVTDSKIPGEKLSYGVTKPLDVPKEIIQDFKKIVSYCRKNDIQLVCFMSALPTARIVNEKLYYVHDFYNKLCNENEVTMIDMNYVKMEYLGRDADDYTDLDGHMMGTMATKQTKVLKDIINSEDRTKFFVNNYDDLIQDILNFNKQKEETTEIN